MKSRSRLAFLFILVLTSCTPSGRHGGSPSAGIQIIPPLSSPTPAAIAPGLATNSSADLLVLQQGNHQPASRLNTLPSQELADNHIGVWWEDYGRYNDPGHIYENGFTRTRLGSLGDWGAPDQGFPLTEATLLPRVDDLVTEYAENGIIITLPTHVGSGVPPLQDDFTQGEIDLILKYTGFVAEHFKGRIAYYEIWNEFGHTEEIDTYVNLIEQSTALIKEIDPDAKVIIGAVPGDWLEDQPGYGEYQRFVVSTRFLNALIDSVNFREVDIDGISWHPIYDNIPEDAYYQEYPQLVKEIQARASSQGFIGEYFADEILWHTWDEKNWDNGPPVSRSISAKYYLRTITEHRGLGVNVTINTFFQVPEMTAIRNLNNVLAGAEPTGIDLLLETSPAVEHTRSYAFTLPDGAIMVAVWINGAAVEEDPGVISTLMIQDHSAERIIGIDVVHGFEQELTAEALNGDLIIHDLLIKDYPIFIRLDHND